MWWKFLTHFLMGICIAITLSVIFMDPKDNIVILVADWVTGP